MEQLDTDRALRLARAFAVIRLGVGAGSLLLPGVADRVLFGPADGGGPGQGGNRVLMRMFAGREIAMGLGSILAGRRGAGAVRGWVEAGGLADGVDAAAFLLDVVGRRGAARPWAAALTAVTAGSASALAPVLARSLSRGDTLSGGRD